MNKPLVFISDLTHTIKGISANTFPLGASYVCSFVAEKLGDIFDFKLFKFPDDLSSAIISTPPDILCFSAYSWNLELSYKFASVYKRHNPKATIIFGGPNFPTEDEEKLEFLRFRANIDFFIELEGEFGVESVLRHLADNAFDCREVKASRVHMTNTTYLTLDNMLNSGPLERIMDVNQIPSPYLTGFLDKFFDSPLIPMLETTRGCPFTCSYCADGMKIKSRIARYQSSRVAAEVRYISDRVDTNNMLDLVITDLNFGMYKEDLVTASYIAQSQEAYGYPKRISAASGKNVPKRITQVAAMIDGWSPGGSIQSSDKDVLKAVRRQNLSLDAYKEVIVYLNSLDEAKTETEIILALPNDTLEKHFKSILFAIDNKVKSLRIFQAIMLIGTEMASPSYRLQYGLKTSFRILPGTVGLYNICGEHHAAPEIEEIITGSDCMSQNDYLNCRVMDLVVSTFYNNSIFEEVYSLLDSLSISPFRLISEIYNNIDRCSLLLGSIITRYKKETMELYKTYQEAYDFASNIDNIEMFSNGILGNNELLEGRARLFSNFGMVNQLLFTCLENIVNESGLMANDLKEYINALSRFIICRKDNLSGISFDREQIEVFDFDFKKISESLFKFDINEISNYKKCVKYRFFHTPEQSKYISSQWKTWSTHTAPLGKLLQNSNLNVLYRNFLEC
jgi:hypothetical protein